MALAASTGCLVTDGLEPRIPPDPPANSWPRVVEASVDPLNWEPVALEGVACEEGKVLSVGKFADENLDDTLYVRLFVDAEPKKQATIQPTTQVERFGFEYTFEPREFCRGYHVVKLLVADGIWDPNGGFDQVRDADRGVASYSWVVDSSACSEGLGPCP